MAVEKRLDAGLGGKMAHGFMHISLIAARLKNAALLGRVLNEFSRLRFVDTSFITCHNPGPRIYNLDTTFSMPAVLTEMLVYSEPGLIEILPALPQAMFGRGTLRGLLARGGVVVEELHWNTTLLMVSVSLRSPRTQGLTLRSGIPLRSVTAEDPAEQKLLSRDDKDQWRISLPADKTVRLRCGI